MNKKFLIIFMIIFLAMVGLFGYTLQNKTDEQPKTSENTNKDDALELPMIENIDKIELSTTSYKYNNQINGYDYTKLEINNVDKVKELLKELDLNDQVEDIVYGKYKLVIDDKTIFFELGTDSALYLEKNITFKFPNDIKKQIVASMDNCSCCEKTSKCKINLCACSNNK